MNNQQQPICQSCHQAPAELTVSYQRGDNRWDLHLCSGCAARLHRHTEAAMREYHRQLMRTAARGGAAPGIVYPAPEPVLTGQVPGPAQEELPRFRTQRELAALRARLEDAVAGELYEDAARLRDQIHFMEKEARAYDGK